MYYFKVFNEFGCLRLNIHNNVKRMLNIITLSFFILSFELLSGFSYKDNPRFRH